MRALALIALAAGCATFEDPTIVLDLRVVGMTAEPPEQVLDVGLGMPPSADELLAQLVPTRVCAHVADPGAERELRWSMTACLPTDDLRCDPERPRVFLTEARLGDPELTGGPDGGRACALIEYDLDPAGWIALLSSALERDPTRGLGGLDYAVELRLGDPAEDPALDAFAVKQARISARFPDTKVANRNPRITELQLSMAFVSTDTAPRRRCADRDSVEQFIVDAGDVVTLFPVEPSEDSPEPAREEFTVPTLDGGFETFIEVVSYQWLGGAGSFADPITGGPPDIFGNQTLLGTEWTAPDVTGVLDVPIWLIQRDERFGVAVYETCIRVRP